MTERLEAARPDIAGLRTSRRWLVLGPGGAGKTTFSLELSRILRLPLIHLDRHYWQAGWIASPDDAWDHRVAKLAQADEWVMDGNYSRTLEPRLRRADVAILLDPPTIQCVGGVLQRMWLDRRKARPDLATGCVERMVPDPQFLYYVATYKRRSRPKVLRRIRDVPRIHFIHLHGRRDARAFLNGLSDKAGRS